LDFIVTWTDERYVPNAEIGIDEESLTAYIRPYCEEHRTERRKVTLSGRTYTVTNEVIDFVYGTAVAGKKTSTGEQVYSGTTGDDETVYFCEVEVITPVEDVLMSVYRREFDGTFTELITDYDNQGSGLENTEATWITDPHPALDYARYRIVSRSKASGVINYFDVPALPIQEKSVVIQWDEKWQNIDSSDGYMIMTNTDLSYNGSILKLPYNIDVSNVHSPDVSLVRYIGRKRPVSYYGTQRGETATWNVEIPKSDTETLYALRRLSIYMGDVYVREPSGSGYWASINISFSQKHLGLTIPVTINITPVEGGI
jgi:hypothetical protein